MKIDGFFKDKHGKVVLWQMPNIPLWTWLITMILGKFTSGTLQHGLGLVSFVALLVWAVLELVAGASPFRRVLGAVVLIFTVASRLFS